MPEAEEIGGPVPQRQHNEDRMRRARAWLRRSGRDGTEAVERFMFLWIAFNAAYGDEASMRAFVEENEDRGDERGRFRIFLRNIVERDESNILEGIVWNEFPQSIRTLLANRYVFHPFWKAVWGSDPGGIWQRRFERSRSDAHTALKRRNTFRVLSLAFDRLYTLRNQIFHGGTTWPSGLGRDQIRDGSRIMAALVPAILDIMQKDLDGNPNSQLWGQVAYPHIHAEEE